MFEYLTCGERTWQVADVQFSIATSFVCRFVLQVQIYLFLSMADVPVFYKRVQITTFYGSFQNEYSQFAKCSNICMACLAYSLRAPRRGLQNTRLLAGFRVGAGIEVLRDTPLKENTTWQLVDVQIFLA